MRSVPRGPGAPTTVELSLDGRRREYQARLMRPDGARDSDGHWLANAAVGERLMGLPTRDWLRRRREQSALEVPVAPVCRGCGHLMFGKAKGPHTCVGCRPGAVRRWSTTSVATMGATCARTVRCTSHYAGSAIQQSRVGRGVGEPDAARRATTGTSAVQTAPSTSARAACRSGAFRRSAGGAVGRCSRARARRRCSCHESWRATSAEGRWRTNGGAACLGTPTSVATAARCPRMSGFRSSSRRAVRAGAYRGGGRRRSASASRATRRSRKRAAGVATAGAGCSVAAAHRSASARVATTATRTFS
jgi:hypothetical protein